MGDAHQNAFFTHTRDAKWIIHTQFHKAPVIILPFDGFNSTRELFLTRAHFMGKLCDQEEAAGFIEQVTI